MKLFGNRLPAADVIEHVKLLELSAGAGSDFENSPNEEGTKVKDELL